MCDCRVCKQSRVFRTYLEGLSESQIDYFEALYENLLEAEEDNSYYKALLDGSWPDADKVIENWRKRCRVQNS